MTGKIFLIENSNLESTAVSIDDVKAKLKDVKFDYVIGQKPSLSSSSFSTLEDFALFLARKFKLLKNDRVLFLTEEESYEMIFLILRKIHKSMTGDSEFPISEILDVYRKLGQSESGSGVIVDMAQKAKLEYLDTLKKNNLVDCWMLSKLLGEKKDFLTSESTNHLLTLNQNLNGSRKRLFRTLFENTEQISVQIELSLDSSLTGNLKDFSLHMDKFDDQIVNCSNTPQVPDVGSNTEKYCRLTMTSYLKLLTNSKDELSLSKLVCSGPEAVLSQKDFHIIRQESGSMPMYQTILSYAKKLELGGKSYAPTESHPFFNFSKELTDFSNLMSKLHDKLEDEQTGEKALMKVLGSIKSQLMKTLRQSSVEMIIEEFSETFKASMARWTKLQAPGQDGKETTPQISKMILLTIDAMSTSMCHFTGNINKMFGKIESDEDESVILKSTPIVCPKIVSLFKTPLIEEEEKKTEDDKGEVSKIATPAKASRDGMCKFTSTMAWANESSPLILRSNERNLRTDGATLAMSAESSTPNSKVSKVIREGMKAAEEALQDAKNAPKPPKSKLSKRSILTDIKNVDKWSKKDAAEQNKKRKLDLTGEDGNAPTNKKKLVDLTGEENESVVKLKSTTAKKSISKKKQPVLLKGQMKMTAFLRV